VAGASGRSLTENLGGGVFVFGVVLSGWAVGVYQTPKKVWGFGLVSGVIIAGAGLTTWIVGRYFRSR
jgi:hypothetical protein